jgi:hypothetical protein
MSITSSGSSPTHSTVDRPTIPPWMDIASFPVPSMPDLPEGGEHCLELRCYVMHRLVAISAPARTFVEPPGNAPHVDRTVLDSAQAKTHP